MNWVIKTFQSQSLVGYKIVAFDGQRAYSLMDKNKTVNLSLGFVDTNIYLGTSAQFCIDYYSGLTDNNDLLLSYSYDVNDVITGDPSSIGEIFVKKAVLQKVTESNT